MKRNEAVQFQDGSNASAGRESDLAASGPVFHMDERVHLLASRLSKIVEFDSFSYDNAREGVSVAFGSVESHKCSYNMKDAGADCGEFTLTRHSPFKEEELMIIETAMASIIHTCHL